MAASTGLIGRSRMRRLGGCFVALLFVMAWVAPASATTIDRFRFTAPYDIVNWDCGYPMQGRGR